MGRIFFPGCKHVALCKSASKRLAAYVKRRFDVDPIGCCRKNHPKLTAQDRAMVICNNCANIIAESAVSEGVDFVWELIDADPDFAFPDHAGRVMTLQDCWRAVEKRRVQDAVRSILRKMNVEVVELEENFERTRFCGTSLLEPCTRSNAALAPRRYVQEGAHMFTPMGPEEQKAWLEKHCRQIQTDEVVCYCTFCIAGIRMGGKRAVHLLDLVFPES